MELSKIIGLKVVGCYGFTSDKRVKSIETQFILFNDGKTIIELTEQDPYSYHDCSWSARNIDVIQNKEQWYRIYNNTPSSGTYLKANKDL